MKMIQENLTEGIREAVKEAAQDAVTETVKGAEEALHEAATKAVIEEKEGTLYLAPTGRLDTVASSELIEKLKEVETAGVDIDVDLAGVAYISSAGLRLLVSLQKKAAASGKTMVIRNPNAVVKEVFRVSGFNKTFTVL